MNIKAKIKIRLLFPVLAAIMILANSCVKDGDRPCPNYLRIVYDYNMQFVDQFHRQVTFLSIFMFDAETGVLVREVKEAQNPFPEDYSILVPEEWFGRAYNIVVWAGLDPGSYDFSEMTPGVSTLDDFQLKVKDYENRLVDRDKELEPLWHGTLSGVTFSDLYEHTFTVSLRKDTRKFRLVVQSMDADYNITSGDLDMRILSADGWYDNQNSVLDPADRGITYLPYYTADDAEVGVVAEMNSMRLINDNRTNSLVIADKNTGNTILEIPLMKYLNALRLLEYANMPFQEYLDRQDEYYILVFLQKEKEDNKNWIAVQIEINEWIIRFQEIEE